MFHFVQYVLNRIDLRGELNAILLAPPCEYASFMTGVYVIQRGLNIFCVQLVSIYRIRRPNPSQQNSPVHNTNSIIKLGPRQSTPEISRVVHTLQ